jgi:hypothetical protein
MDRQAIGGGCLRFACETKRVIEPIENAGVREAVSAALAVRTGTLSGCETDHGLRAGEVLKKHVRLALQVHILFGIEDQRRTGDLLRDAAGKGELENFRNGSMRRRLTHDEPGLVSTPFWQLANCS